MYHVRLRITLTLLGPVLTQSTTAGAFGIDALMARNPHGRPYLPYSLVRGRLRQSLEELESALDGSGESLSVDLTKWFGLRQPIKDPAQKYADTNQQRGLLRLTDFEYPQAIADEEVRSRIKMDADTGAAERKMLLTLESPFKSGEPATFTGEITLIVVDLQTIEKTTKVILAGLRWTHQLGAERTIGFGRLDGVSLDEVQVTDLAPWTPATPLPIALVNSLASEESARLSVARPSRLRLRPDPQGIYGVKIRPRRPFCFGGWRKRSNIYESETIIPGNALLGAIATTWREASGLPPSQREVVSKPGSHWANLEKNFARLRFTHAVPAPAGSNRRPIAVPLSLVAEEPTVGETPDRLYDVAFCEEACLVGCPEKPPVFQTDWKGHVVWKSANRMFGWPTIPKELRVRTAIDLDKLRAKDKSLFAYEMIVPDQLEWLAYLDLSRIKVDERQAVLEELHALWTAGLGPLGKTKADADVEFVARHEISPVFASSCAPLHNEYWIVTLQTPAILCSAEDMRFDEDQTPKDRLFAGYAKVWREISGDQLALVRFFASQSLWGGHFDGGTPRDTKGFYYPFILTEAGSTFVLQATGNVDDAIKLMQQWAAHGLPLAKSLCARFHPDSEAAWKHCPFLPGHGYGEISVNLPWLTHDPGTRNSPIRLSDA